MFSFLSFNDGCCMVKSHALYYVGEKSFQTFLEFESESRLGIKNIFCKRTLGWDI